MTSIPKHCMKRQKLMAQDIQKSFFQITFPLGKPYPCNHGIIFGTGILERLDKWFILFIRKSGTEII